jgi:hypothetical protein
MDAAVGLVYIMRAGDRVKIGWCAGDVQKRRAELQTGCPDLLEIIVTFPGTRADEATLHADFAALRGVGEWFRYEEPLVRFVKLKTRPDRTTNRRAPSSAFIECAVAVKGDQSDSRVSVSGRTQQHVQVIVDHRVESSDRLVTHLQRQPDLINLSCVFLTKLRAFKRQLIATQNVVGQFVDL